MSKLRGLGFTGRRYTESEGVSCYRFLSENIENLPNGGIAYPVVTIDTKGDVEYIERFQNLPDKNEELTNVSEELREAIVEMAGELGISIARVNHREIGYVPEGNKEVR